MNDFDELCKKVDILTKEVRKLTKLTTDIAKSLQLIPVTEDELAKFTKIRLKNEEKVAEAVHLIEENTKSNDGETVSLFGETQYKGAQDIYGDVLGDDFLGGVR